MPQGQAGGSNAGGGQGGAGPRLGLGTLEGSGVPLKTTKSYAFGDLSAAALTKTITLLSLPAGYTLEDVNVEQTTQFDSTGDLVTELYASIGISGVTEKYLPETDILAAPGATAFGRAVNQLKESRTAGTDILLTIRAVGANLSTLTAGALRVAYRTSGG